MNQSTIDKFTVAVSRLSEATAVKHEFDATLDTRCGGPVRYVLELEGRPFLAWFDQDTAVIVVTPLEKWDIDDWIDMEDDAERIPILSFREVDGAAFVRMAAEAIAAPVLPAMNAL